MEENKILFLGTAGDVTSVNKQLRGSGGIVFIYNGNQFHIDPGPGSLIRCKNHGINPRSTLGLIVTNNELCHCADTNVMVSAMTHDGMDNRGVLIASQSIIESSESENAILWKRYRAYLERNIVLKPGERVGINETEIYGITARTKDPTGMGLKIVTNNFTIAYTSDTKYSPGVVRNYEDSDILILKLVHPDNNENSDKLNVSDAVKIIKETIPRVAIITGFGSKMISSDPVFVAREIQRETGVQVFAAHEGFYVNPDQYSKKIN